MNTRGWILFFALAAGCGGSMVDKGVREDIKTAVTSSGPALEACYAEALAEKKDLTGQMVVSFQTQVKTGAFVNVKVVKSTLAHPALQQCVVDTFSKLKLAKPAKVPILVDKYPLDFAPSQPQ